MQIHELNNYNGDLDSGAYLAVDNGDDTGKVSAAGLVADVNQRLSLAEETLNERIDNIITPGSAPSEAEVTDARQGATGHVYSSLGDAIRGQTGIFQKYNSITFTANYNWEPCFIPSNEKIIVRTLDGTNFTGGSLIFRTPTTEINSWSLPTNKSSREVYPDGQDCYFIGVGGVTDPTNIQVCSVFEYKKLRPIVNNLGSVWASGTGGNTPTYDSDTGKLNLKTGNLVFRIAGTSYNLDHATVISQLGSSIASENGSGELIINLGSEYFLVYDTRAATLKRISAVNYSPDYQIALFCCNYNNGFGGLLAMTMIAKSLDSVTYLDAMNHAIYAYLTNGGTIKDYNAGAGSINIGQSNITIYLNGHSNTFDHATIIAQLGAAKASEDASGNLTIKIGPGYVLVYNYSAAKLEVKQLNSVNKSAHLVLFTCYYLSGSIGLLAESDNNLKIRLNKDVTPTRLLNSSPSYVDTDLQANLTRFSKAVMNAGLANEHFLFFSDPHCFGGDYMEHLVGMMSTIQKYYNSSPADFILSGGDWLGNSDTLDTAAYKLGLVNGIGKSMLGNADFYNIVGNHDTNYQGSPTLTEKQLRNIWYSGDKCYYAIKRKNCTFYALDTGDDNDNTLNAYRIEQLKWLCNQLIQNDGAHNAIFMHIVFMNAENPSVISNMAVKTGEIITAYNGRTSIMIDGVSFNFAQCHGSIDFILTGHIHDDYNITLGGVPCVSVINTGAAGTGTASFDLCVADFDNGKLKMIRVGSGSDREFSI